MNRTKKITAIISTILLLGTIIYQVSAGDGYYEYEGYYSEDTVYVDVDEEQDDVEKQDDLYQVMALPCDVDDLLVVVPDDVDGDGECETESNTTDEEEENEYIGFAPMFDRGETLSLSFLCYHTDVMIAPSMSIPVTWTYDEDDPSVPFTVSFSAGDIPSAPVGWNVYVRNIVYTKVVDETVTEPFTQVGDRFQFDFPFEFTIWQNWILSPVIRIYFTPDSPSILKEANPISPDTFPVLVGEIVEYTVTITNPAVNPNYGHPGAPVLTTFNGFRVVDQLPVELSLIINSVEVAGGAGVVNNSVGNVVDVSFDLPGSNVPGHPVVITFQARVTSAALLVDEIINRAYLYHPRKDTPIYDDARVPVADPPILEKQVLYVNNVPYTGQVVVEGDVVAYRLRVRNPNDRILRNHLVRDALPPGLTLIEVQQIVPATALVADQSTGNTIQVILDLPPGDTDVIFTARVDDGSQAVDGKFINIAHLYGPPDEGGERPPVDRDDAEIEVLPAHVSLVKSVSSGTVAPGGDLTYTIVVTNTGGIRLTNLVVRDDLPVQLTNPRNLVITPAGAGTGRFDGQLLVVNIPSLAVRDSVTITFVVTVGEGVAYGTTIRNVASVTTDQNVRAEDNVTVNIPGGGGEDPPDPPPQDPPPRAPATGDMGMNSPYLISFLISLLSIFAILSFESLKKGSKGKK